MRRIVSVSVVGCLLGCSGLFPVSGEVVDASARCGFVELTIEPQLTSGTAQVFVDDRAAETVELRGQRVVLGLAVPGGSHTLRIGGGPPVSVDVPFNDLTVRAFAPDPPPLEGEPVGVGVQVLGSCGLGGVMLQTTVAASGATREVSARSGPQRLALGALAEGRHEVAVRLRRGDVVLAEDLVSVRVDPPCRSEACRDRDGDGFAGLSVGGLDCDDTRAEVFPGATEWPDPDGDGAVALREADLDCDGQLDLVPRFDCAEGDPTIPREEEPVPTGVDEDCDGLVDEGTTAFDDDGDGFAEEDGDCNDDDVSVAPGRAELPDCKDNDCDGAIDDGVARPTEEDAYEPNDDAPFVLAGAQPRWGPFGGHRPTEDRLHMRVRGARDVEAFSLFAHDGSGDSFHVTAKVLSAGDGQTYRVRIEGPHKSEEEVLGVGGTLRLGGRVLDDDSGTYTLRITPEGEVLTHCPLLVELTSG